jgi:hypothetical protein
LLWVLGEVEEEEGLVVGVVCVASREGDDEGSRSVDDGDGGTAAAARRAAPPRAARAAASGVLSFSGARARGADATHSNLILSLRRAVHAHTHSAIRRN